MNTWFCEHYQDGVCDTGGYYCGPSQEAVCRSKKFSHEKLVEHITSGDVLRNKKISDTDLLRVLLYFLVKPESGPVPEYRRLEVG